MKKGTGYTPGPWSVMDGQDVVAINGAETRLIAQCHAGHSPERAANALLIASAPELAARVEAMEAALRDIAGWTALLVRDEKSGIVSLHPEQWFQIRESTIKARDLLVETKP